jgi:hypothetical protein
LRFKGDREIGLRENRSQTIWRKPTRKPQWEPQYPPWEAKYPLFVSFPFQPTHSSPETNSGAQARISLENEGKFVSPPPFQL